VNLVELEVSIPALRVVVGLALTIVALALLVEMTLLMGMLLCTLKKNFKNQIRVYIFGQGFDLEFRSCDKYIMLSKAYRPCHVINSTNGKVAPVVLLPLMAK